MKRITFLLLVSFLSQYLFASDSLLCIKSIPIKGHLFSTDPIGNIYVVQSNNSLIRYNEKGDSTGIFNDIKKGKITQIDATNPLRLLLFFTDYQQIIILDNLLSQKAILRFANMGIIRVPCIAGSADGNIWMYDPTAGNLIKINDKQNILFTSSVRNVLPNPIDPIFMVEQDRTLFVVDTIAGVKKFDSYGFYNTTFPIHTKQVQYVNDYLLYYHAPYLYSYNLRSTLEKKMDLPEPDDILQVRMERNKVFILRKKSLDIYLYSTQ